MEQEPKTLTVMNIEENITPELIAALSKAQAKFGPALKDELTRSLNQSTPP